MDNRNKELLEDFSQYCASHPNERFWQALRNWSKRRFIYVSDIPLNQADNLKEANEWLEDTFYWENKNN